MFMLLDLLAALLILLNAPAPRFSSFSPLEIISFYYLTLGY